MQVRRCAVLWLESREVAHFELNDLLAGGTGVVSAMRWFAYAPHLPEAVNLDIDAAQVLGTLSPTDWIETSSILAVHGGELIERLIAFGLLVSDDPRHATQLANDEQHRAQHWYGLSSVWHAASRWDGIDAAGEVAEAGMDTALGLRTKYGAPPPVLYEREGVGALVSLARAARTALDELMDQRSTCRNFDTAALLPQPELAHVLERVFGLRGQVHAADDFDVIKRTSPSGGAMHPTEAYLIVRKVEGIAPGLYHYRVGDHALQPLPLDAETITANADKHAKAGEMSPLDYLAWIAVGGQQWFADAHVLVVLAPRFARNFWKYRNHAKAYRVAILDVGHLSQTLLLTATELGLGSYITAAINEVDIERAFGLTHYVDGPLAVCGFGPRADTMVTSEFDPNRKVWPRKAKV